MLSAVAAPTVCALLLPLVFEFCTTAEFNQAETGTNLGLDLTHQLATTQDTNSGAMQTAGTGAMQNAQPARVVQCTLIIPPL